MLIRDIDVTLLRTFVAVAETGGMTRATLVLNLTQSAVSQQIKKLEELLGVELFDRSQKQLTLTAQGERLLPHAQRFVALNNEIWRLMTSPEFEGEVRLGVPTDIVRSMIPPILKAFQKIWPSINVKLICTTSQKLLQELNEGNIDLTLTTEAQNSKTGELLLIDRLVWVGAHKGEAVRRTPLPIALGDKTCAFRPVTLKALSDSKINWLLVGPDQDASMAPLLTTIEADLAIAPLLSQTIPPELEIISEEGRLPKLPSFFINLYRRPGQLSPLAQELEQHIKHTFMLRYPKVA